MIKKCLKVTEWETELTTDVCSMCSHYKRNYSRRRFSLVCPIEIYRAWRVSYSKLGTPCTVSRLRLQTYRLR